MKKCKHYIGERVGHPDYCDCDGMPDKTDNEKLAEALVAAMNVIGLIEFDEQDEELQEAVKAYRDRLEVVIEEIGGVYEGEKKI